MLRFTTQMLKVTTIAVMTILVALAGLRFFDYYIEREASADTGKPVAFFVDEEDDADTVATKLAAAGLIRSPTYFKLRLRLANADILPGAYTLRKGWNVPMIVEEITGDAAVDPTAAPPIEVLTVEGWRTEQIATALAEAGLEGGAEAFLGAVASAPVERYDFLADRPDGASLEGYLFPATYTLPANAAPGDVVSYMLDTFGAQFTPSMRQRAAAMGLSIHDVVTLASIVEREAAIPEERPIVAGVYLNRLAVGMRLDADPTVQYALGTPAEWWPKPQPEDLHVQSPYNTYLNDGLPPGPIASPGLASIQAVLSPAEHDYIYFVAKGDGTHAFAATAEEQQRNIDTYLNDAEDVAIEPAAP